jgi:hypothetical protein
MIHRIMQLYIDIHHASFLGADPAKVCNDVGMAVAGGVSKSSYALAATQGMIES